MKVWSRPAVEEAEERMSSCRKKCEFTLPPRIMEVENG